MFGPWSSIQLYKAKRSDLQAQLLKNSTTLSLKQKHSSNDIQKIHEKYDQEEQMVRNEMNSLDDKTGNEYLELLSELEEIKDEDDRECEVAEAAAQEYEQKITVENSSIETQLQAVNADIEGFEEMRKDSIEKNFGYFKS